MNRFCLQITGESGAGLLSTGEILMNAFKEMGYYVVADREFPSLIKGGASCFRINIDDEPIYGLSERVDVMLSIDRQSMEVYHDDLKDEGVMVYGYERPLGVKEVVEELEARKCTIVHGMSRQLAEDAGGNVLMVNVVLVGMLWKALGLPYEVVEEEVKRKFASKPRLLEIDLKCLKAGFEEANEVYEMPKVDLGDVSAKILVNAHKTLAAGAVHAGVRAYFAYPMSPSSKILTYMADWQKQTGMVVKQIEDEISVANMTLGAMYMGTRALCATSGGGFDLMTETVSLAAITETPFVVVVAQRPGPATGLPTWTGQGDLNLAINAAHGEFTRLVVAVGDSEDAFDLIQYAMNYAEVYQIPVIVLTEKQLDEMMITIDKPVEGKIEIERGLVEGGELDSLVPEDRYRITENGISKRWKVGASREAYFCANGDEHGEDGSVTEDADKAAEMYAKRLRKGLALLEELPEPEVFGVESGAEISFVGWGSTKGVMRDFVAMMEKEGKKVNYLHYSYVWPLKTERLVRFFEENENVHLVEGNYTGQLGELIRKETGLEFAGKMLKWNGRSIFLEDITNYLNG